MKLPSSRLPLAVAIQSLLATAFAQAATQNLDSVTVYGKYIQQQLEAQRAQTPGAVTVVDAEKLREGNVSTLSDMLRYVPGVWTDSATGTDEVFFSSRGSNLDATDYDRNGIKLLQDGLPVTAADGNNHNRLTDPLAARYAIVAHGANALAFGASTLGGAINFISPTARTLSSDTGSSTPVEISLDYGSFGTRSARATAGAVAGDFDGLVTLEGKDFDGYRDHSSLQRRGIYANAGWQFSDAVDTRFFATYVNSDVDLAGTLTRDQVRADRDQARAEALAGDYKKELETWRIANKTTWQLDDNGMLEFGLSLEEQALYHPIVDKILIDFDGSGPNPPQEVFSLLIDTDHRDIGTTLRYTRKVGDHDLSAGLNYGVGDVEGGNYRNDGGQRNGLSEKVDNHSTSLELFALDRWRLDPRWTLVYGAQFVSASRDVKTTNAGSGEVRNPDADYSSVNPRIGAIFTLSSSSELFTNLSRVYEAPTTFELEDDVRGNAEALDAMHGSVLEIGSRGTSKLSNTDSLRWEVTAYYAKIRDEILSVDDPAASGNSFATNIDKTTHSGIEALLGASFAVDSAATHRVEPLLSITLNDFAFDNDASYGDNRLPAAPKYFARGELMYRNSNGFYAGPTFDFIGKRYVDFANNYAVDAYSLLGLRTGFKAKKWEVYGELKNALDKNYISTVSVLNAADDSSSVLNPGAPRAAYVGARLQF